MARATARHILVSSEAKCNELKTAIEGGADFAEVAREHSSCPSGRDGGNLGSFGPGQMVREFDQVVFSAPLNVVQGAGEDPVRLPPAGGHQPPGLNVRRITPLALSAVPVPDDERRRPSTRQSERRANNRCAVIRRCAIDSLAGLKARSSGRSANRHR